MADTDDRLRRGEAPKLLSSLRLALERDFSYRYSRPEVRDGMHSAMPVDAVRKRYGLPDALPEVKIEAVMTEVVRGRAQALTLYVVAVRARDKKAVHLEEVERVPAGMTKQQRAAIEVATEAAVTALSDAASKRGRSLKPVPAGAEPDVRLFGMEGLDPAAAGIGPLVAKRGLLLQGFAYENCRFVQAACQTPKPRPSRRGFLFLPSALNVAELCPTLRLNTKFETDRNGHEDITTAAGIACAHPRICGHAVVRRCGRPQLRRHNLHRDPGAHVD